MHLHTHASNAYPAVPGGSESFDLSSTAPPSSPPAVCSTFRTGASRNKQLEKEEQEQVEEDDEVTEKGVSAEKSKEERSAAWALGDVASSSSSTIGA